MRKRSAGILLVALAFIGTLVHYGERAFAYTCNNGECKCGSQDLDPATTLPKLNSGDWEHDCQELTIACTRLNGTPQCQEYTSEDCKGGSCSYDPTA